MSTTAIPKPQNHKRLPATYQAAVVHDFGHPLTLEQVDMPALTIRPVDRGWVVCLTNGQVLAAYRGAFAKRLALRYLRRYARAAP